MNLLEDLEILREQERHPEYCTNRNKNKLQFQTVV